ncbi:MAG: hypothetical protein M1827_002253 [Pycnora praestabilis]|nr:MAG: hypothetical protein M1827_002253 [Pycnora praestabilis]
MDNSSSVLLDKPEDSKPSGKAERGSVVKQDEPLENSAHGEVAQEGQATDHGIEVDDEYEHYDSSFSDS